MNRSVRLPRLGIVVVACAIAAPVSAQTISPPKLRLDPGTVDVQAPAPTSTFSSPSFGSLFKDTITDFRRLPSIETVTILAIGASVATAGHRADHMLTAFSGSSGSAKFFQAGEVLGGARFQLGGALATYVIGRATGDRKIAAVGADLVRANIVAQTMTSTVKMSARRTRPDGTSYSFPSGHASVSFATATVLQKHFGWKAGIPAYAAASYVAGSRIQGKRHFFSDVAFGAAIGIVAGRTVTLAVGKHRFNVAPQASLRGAGVGVTWD